MTLDIRFEKNFKLLLIGPSRCGKTTFLLNMIKRRMELFKQEINIIIYFYKVYQDCFKQLEKENLNCYFFEDGEDNLEKIEKITNNQPALIIFDDLINSKNLEQVARLYTVEGRHKNLSIAFLSQKLFQKNEYYKQISANTDYMIIFKNPRNFKEISILSGQLSPGKNCLTKIFMKATKSPYSYILINLTQNVHENLKYISNLFSPVVTTYSF